MNQPLCIKHGVLAVHLSDVKKVHFGSSKEQVMLVRGRLGKLFHIGLPLATNERKGGLSWWT